MANEISIGRLEEAVRHTRRTHIVSSMLRHLVLTSRIAITRRFCQWQFIVHKSRELAAWEADLQESANKAIRGEVSLSNPTGSESPSIRRGTSSTYARSPTNDHRETGEDESEGMPSDHQMSHPQTQVKHTSLLELCLSHMERSGCMLRAHVGVLIWRHQSSIGTQLAMLSETVAHQADENASLRAALRESRAAVLEMAEEASIGLGVDVDPATVAMVDAQADVMKECRVELEAMGLLVHDLQSRVAEKEATLDVVQSKEEDLRREVLRGHTRLSEYRNEYRNGGRALFHLCVFINHICNRFCT